MSPILWGIDSVAIADENLLGCIKRGRNSVTCPIDTVLVEQKLYNLMH
ncbi:hypothetical protein V7152_22795 [Neobacillus drentensis]